MQSGSQDQQASESAREAGTNLIEDVSCILVLLTRQS
nr:hypothetical protein [Rubripirellula lacrimiformis]